MKLRPFLLLAPVLLGLMLLSGCEKYNTTAVSIEFELRNGSGIDNTNMWLSTDTEDQGPTINSGVYRTIVTRVDVETDTSNKTKMTAYVGRNGAQIGYKEFEVSLGTTKVIVFYDGTYLAVAVN